jgi:hypothetical protein
VEFADSCDLSMTIGGKKFKLAQWHIHNGQWPLLGTMPCNGKTDIGWAFP